MHRYINTDPQTFQECGDAIDAAMDALKSAPYVIRTLKEGNIPMNELYAIQAAGRGLVAATERVEQLWTEAREKALEEMRNRK